MSDTRLHPAAPGAVRTATEPTRPRRFSVPDRLTCRAMSGCVFSPGHGGTCLPRPPRTSGGQS